MPTAVKYLFAAGVSVGLVMITSLVWPKFTARPEPQPLERVRNAVLNTEVGEQAAQLLGAQSDKLGNPINLNDTISSVAGAVSSSVEEHVQKIISEQIATQVVKQYQQLPVGEQTRVTEVICKSKE